MATCWSPLSLSHSPSLTLHDKAFGVYTCVYDCARERARGIIGWREAKGRSREAGGAILVYSRRVVVVAASGGSAGVAFAILPTGFSRKVGVGLVRGCGPHTVPPRFVLAPFPPFFLSR